MSMDRRRAITLSVGAAALTAAAEAPAAAQADNTTADTRIPAVATDAQLARSLPGDFRSRHATVNGVRLHYVAGGRGAPLVLLPGWPETWWEYRKVMPALAASRRVIVVELRGMGGSDKPASGYDKKTMAADVYGLVRSLGYDKVDIAGHDIGSMVAFSFAVNHPQATRKVAVLDVLHPDENYYEVRMLPQPGVPLFPWWFAFNQVSVLPEQLVAGRSDFLINWMFDHLLLNKNAVDATDRAIYAHAYSTPDAIRAGNGWYQTFGQDITDLATYGKVTAPMLGMVNPLFAPQMLGTLPNEGTDVRVVQVENTGHYFLEEQPQAVIDEFDRFFV